MRVLVCEFVTGGGMRGEVLRPSLAREGAMMQAALLRDLADLGLDLVTTHDDRLAAPKGVESVAIGEADDAFAVWETLAKTTDVAWAVAPETGGVLARLVALLAATGARIIGPDVATIEICASKARTIARLAACGVAAAPAWGPGETVSEPGLFVQKPDDGAGCEDVRLTETAPSPIPAGCVIQLYVPGDAASLTVLAEDGRARLLAANRQRVTVEDGVFAFRGLSVGALEDRDGSLAALAGSVVAALPGLSGIFGIDIVLSVDGPVVIEVNPRLTTAYAALRDALGTNPAALVAPFGGFDAEIRTAREVEVAL